MKHARRRVVTIPASEPVVDHGTVGEAQKIRPYIMQEQKTKQLAQEKLQLTAYEAGSGIKNTKYVDVHIIDRWTHACLLTKRQIDAAWVLTRCYTKGYPPRHITADYGECRACDSSPEAELDQTNAMRRYDGLMKAVRPEYRHVLTRMVMNERPEVMGWVNLIRLATDQLADILKLPREVFTNGKGWSA